MLILIFPIMQMILAFKDGWEIGELIVRYLPVVGGVLADTISWWEANQWIGLPGLGLGFVWLVLAVRSPVGFPWSNMSIGDTTPEGTILIRYRLAVKESTRQLNRGYHHLRNDKKRLAKIMDTVQTILGRPENKASRMYLANAGAREMPQLTKAIQKHGEIIRIAAGQFFEAHQGLAQDYPQEAAVSNSVWAILWGAQAQSSTAAGLLAELSVLATGLQHLYDSRRMGNLDAPVSALLLAVRPVETALSQIIEARTSTAELFARSFGDGESVTRTDC